MTKRELVSCATRVLGPGAEVEIYREGRLQWITRAGTVSFAVIASGLSREQAVTRVHAMLSDLDASGWRWEEA